MQVLAEAGVIYLSKRRPALSDLWFRSKAVWRHDPERHRDLAIHRIPAAVGRRASSVGRARIHRHAVRMRGLGALIRSGLAAIAAVIAPRSAHGEGATANEILNFSRGNLGALIAPRARTFTSSRSSSRRVQSFVGNDLHRRRLGETGLGQRGVDLLDRVTFVSIQKGTTIFTSSSTRFRRGSDIRPSATGRSTRPAICMLPSQR
jgi:hypothetical protein